MKNLHLSEALYLKDFDSILSAQFNLSPISMQPTSLVEIDCGDGYLLKHAYDYIKSHTLRGKHLHEYPFEVVAVVSNKEAVESIRRKIANIPHQITFQFEKEQKKGLFLKAFTGNEISEGIELHKSENLPAYLLKGANQGFFPKLGTSFHYGSQFALNHFESRSYIIRNPTLQDLPELIRLEKACWSEGVARPESVIAKRIKEYPEGQYILEEDHKIKGVAYTQRIVNLEDVYEKKFDTIENLHQPNGSIVQLLALNVDPEYQKIQFGKELLEFTLQISSLDATQIIGITRALEPVIRMHEGQGGEIKKSLPNFRQNEEGLLVVYPVNDRKIILQKSIPELSNDWLYGIEWKESEAKDEAELPLDRLWVIFAGEEENLAHSIRELLRAHRQYCVIVSDGPQFEKISDETFKINPLQSQDFVTLFESHPKISQLTGVIYLGGFEQEWHKKSCGGLIHLANVLSSMNPVKLWVLADSIAEDGTEEALKQVPLTGICQVISEEYDQIKAVYLAVHSREEMPQRLFYEITRKEEHAHDFQILWSEGKRYVPRLAHGKLEEVKKPKFSSENSYLIVGGLNPLGFQLVQWLVDQGVKHLILFDEEKGNAQKLESFRNKGIDITTHEVKCDNVEKMKSLLPKNLKGIFHTVPLLDDELLRHTTWETMQEMYRLRVLGCWNLHQLSQSIDLDYFVLFSSFIPDIAPAGKCSQAMARGFLNALSYFRRKNNLPSLTIDWGLWDLKQVIVKHVIETKLLRERLPILKIEEAFHYLEAVLEDSPPSIILAKMNLTKVRKELSQSNRLFEVTTERTRDH